MTRGTERRHLSVLLCLAAVCLMSACEEGNSTSWPDGAGPGGLSGLGTPIPAGSATLSSYSDLMELVVKSSACTGDDALTFTYLSLWYFTKDFGDSEWSDKLACVGPATDCETVLGCLGYTGEPCNLELDDQEFCVDGDTRRYCIGTDTETGAGEWFETKCSDPMGNDQCFLDWADWAMCGVGSCPDEDDGEQWCEGDVIMECWEGIMSVWNDCSLTGRSCRLNEYEEGFCSYDAACDVDYCEGSVVVDCEYGFETEHFDCADFDHRLSCVVVVDPEFEDNPEWADLYDESEYTDAICNLPQDEMVCVPGEVLCQGKEARVCIQGLWMVFDCSLFPGATCELVEHDPDEWFNLGDGVRCTLP